MLLNLYYIIWKGSSEIVTNGWKEKCVKESEFLAPLCLPGFLGLLLTIFTIFLFCFCFFKVYRLSEFWRGHKGQPHYIGFGWAIHWHRGMTAIQEGKFGHKSILWPVWTCKLPWKPGISNSSCHVSVYPQPDWEICRSARTVSMQEASLDNYALFYQPLV